MVMNRALGVISTLFLLVGLLPYTWAGTVQHDFSRLAFQTSSHPVSRLTIYMAQAGGNSERDQEPKSGTLLMPENYNKEQTKKQQTCIRACSDWGETCVYDINKGRKCRRTCKETTMECFDK